MRFLLLAGILAASLPAQFYSLAATDTGTLYFSTTLITGTEDSRSKIYRIAGDTIELFATGGAATTVPIFAPSAVLPLTSGDGSITSYAIYYPCMSGSCGLSGVPRTYFQFPGLANSAFSSLQISRNGRFLLGSILNLRPVIIEVGSFAVTPFPDIYFSTGPQSIANDGTILLRDFPQHLYIAPLGQPPRLIPGADGVGGASLSPNGDRIAYERSGRLVHELLLTDPQGSHHRQLANVPRGDFGYQPSFANDGTLLYITPGALMILAPGGEPKPLYSEAGIQRAIVSGDGQLVWLVSASGQLLRIQRATGAVTEVIPETPFVFAGSNSVLPGSVVRFSGSGLSERTKVQVDNVTFPISEASSKGGAAQVPWEFASSNPGVRPLVIQGPGNPFRQEVNFSATDRPIITFERDFFSPAPALQAAHQDFRGKVTKDDPARPGETIHVFAGNMGPVDRPVATGERSPADPVARITTPMACYLHGPNRVRGVEVPFAGLAAGSIGIYQIDVTIPEDWSESSTRLECTFDNFRGDTEPLDIATAEPPR